jgi:hypothetical protein
MYTKEQIESLFGSKAVEYVQRKNTGGTSSSKGIKYKVAPILRKYQEPSDKKVKYLIVLKSIISGACVVRTNLVNLIQTNV